MSVVLFSTEMKWFEWSQDLLFTVLYNFAALILFLANWFNMKIDSIWKFGQKYVVEETYNAVCTEYTSQYVCVIILPLRFFEYDFYPQVLRM